MPTPIRIRSIYKTPWAPGPIESRPALIGSEVEPIVTLDLGRLTASGHIGSFAALPADLASAAQRYNSVAWQVQFSDDPLPADAPVPLAAVSDRDLMIALAARTAYRAAQQAVLGLALDSTVRI